MCRKGLSFSWIFFSSSFLVTVRLKHTKRGLEVGFGWRTVTSVPVPFSEGFVTRTLLNSMTRWEPCPTSILFPYVWVCHTKAMIHQPLLCHLSPSFFTNICCSTSSQPPPYHMNCRLCTRGITWNLRQPWFMLQYKLHCKLCCPQRRGMLTRAPVVQIPPFFPDQSPARSSHGQHGLGFRSLGMVAYPHFQGGIFKGASYTKIEEFKSKHVNSNSNGYS